MNVDGQINPSQLTDGAGVPHGKALADFVAATRSDGATLAAARDMLAEAMSPESVVDAAAVVANFTMMTRIADGTGTPLDPGTEDMTGDLRESLGVNDFDSMRVQR